MPRLEDLLNPLPASSQAPAEGISVNTKVPASVASATSVKPDPDEEIDELLRSPPITPSPLPPSPMRASSVNYDPNHQPHPDCPSALSCLEDTIGRPQYAYPIIMRSAILGSPKQRLTIRQLYEAFEEKYPYFKEAGDTWKQSVRHYLSLSRTFERRPRPMVEPGQGSYWTVNLDAPPGTKRPRKRGRRPPPDPNTASKRGRPRVAYGSVFVEANYPSPPQPVKAEPDELCGDSLKADDARAPTRPRWWPTPPPLRSPPPRSLPPLSPSLLSHPLPASIPSSSSAPIDNTRASLPPLAPLRAVREDDYYSSDDWESEDDTSSTAGNPSKSPWAHEPDATPKTLADIVQRGSPSPHERDAPRKWADSVHAGTSASPVQHGVALRWKDPVQHGLESPTKRRRMDADTGGRLVDVETGNLVPCRSPPPTSSSSSFQVRFANDMVSGGGATRRKRERKVQPLRWRIVDCTNRTYASNPPPEGEGT